MQFIYHVNLEEFEKWLLDRLLYTITFQEGFGHYSDQNRSFNPILPGGGAFCARADFNEL